VVWRDVEFETQAPVRVQPLERAQQAGDRGSDNAREARCVRRGRRARPREVAVDLTAHAVDLSRDRAGEVGAAGGGRTLCVPGQDGERRLQAVDEARSRLLGTGADARPLAQGVRREGLRRDRGGYRAGDPVLAGYAEMTPGLRPEPVLRIQCADGS